MKNILSSLAYRLGYRLLPIHTVTQNAFKAQAYLAGSSPITIFDIGAHTGETARHYNRIFNSPAIYSFEPFLSSYKLLEKNVKTLPNIKVFNTAISNFTGEVDFHVNKSSATNSILPASRESAENWGENLLDTVEIIKTPVITIDDFVERNEIQYIDILKIDTQGTEYEVIEGAEKTISQNKIKLVYLEIILVSTYDGQKFLDEVLLLMRDQGFSLYNIYNQTHADSGELKQLDAIFINRNEIVETR